MAPSISQRLSEEPLTVLLGDPRLPYSYNLSGRFESHDYEDVERLRQALAELDYDFHFLDHHDEFQPALSGSSTAVVVNFCNTGFMNQVSRQLHVPALLEILDLPYLGAGPECMAVCHDKAMVMAVAAQLGIPTPSSRFFRVGDSVTFESQAYPVIMKPNFGDGSIGMADDAVVYDDEQAIRCLRRLGREFDRPGVLIQTYLPGPEYSVGLIGNPDGGFTGLPPLEVDFTALGDNLRPIMTHAAKVDPESPYWRQIRLRRADLADAVRDRLHADCRALFERLNCRDYARFDFRCDADGTPRLIDVNAHPMWGEGGMMATMAGFAGYSYAGMLDLIIAAGLRRLGVRVSHGASSRPDDDAPTTQPGECQQ